jgi:hypothetical protein
MEDKIYGVLAKYGIDEPKASAITEDLLFLCAVVGRSEQYCECEAPLIRTGTGGDDQEYCGICELDIK